MFETLKQGLLITAVGMGIVFAMILVIWAIMALLVRLTNRPEQEESQKIPPRPNPPWKQAQATQRRWLLLLQWLTR